ncbi:MAG: cellulase [Bacteroidales bacterium]|nr:cellulase [Bacteroidales bacterium]
MAITMWDFSWLERRWPGAGYEDYDKILDELTERGYDAVRIDVYPHLVYSDPFREYELVPHWNTHDWGSPDYITISVEPHLTEFVSKCRERDIKVGLSSWWREDSGRSYDIITSPQMLAEVWLAVLDLLNEKDLLDSVIYVDLTNEWTLDEWTPYKKGLGGWASEESILWMWESIDVLKEKYPGLKYTFSFTGEVVEQTKEWGDITMLDFLEQHIWMVNYNNGEFYNEIDYHYEAFDPAGYQKIAKHAEKLYYERQEYWIDGLKKQIKYAAAWSEYSDKPLITTECWGLVTYKDWPLLKWGWIKDLCEIGVREAASTGRWVAMSTSNFCGPQFVGMWRDIDWHQRMTDIIHQSKVPGQLLNSFYS